MKKRKTKHYKEEMTHIATVKHERESRRKKKTTTSKQKQTHHFSTCGEILFFLITHTICMDIFF